MKDISKRTYFAMGLACLLLFGLLTFLVRYALFADDWVVFQGSPHVYNSTGSMDTGIVTDRSGKLLMNNSGGVTYAEDALVRMATLHILGDREGNIADRVIPNYADSLLGYDKINGTYGTVLGAGECVLTISADVEKIALQALNGRKGTIGVYNYKTGEILCMVSAPTFDPDNLPDIAGDTSGAYDGAYINRFLYASYTPGSIFKLVTTAAAIETIPDIMEQTFECKGEVTVNGEVIRCQKAHGTQTLKQALANSCNGAFASIANQLGEDTLNKYVEKIGIKESLCFDGISTTPGSFDLKNANENEVAWAGIGQYTDLVNPCQFMTYMGAIAGGGSAAEPYLVQEARCGGDVKYAAKTAKTGKILDSDTAQTLQELMRNNVETVYGTGNFPAVKVCAKSGTAEVGEGSRNTATFAGFVMDEDYPLAFIVVVEEGGAGSATCAPIAGKVLQACINVLDGEK